MRHLAAHDGEERHRRRLVRQPGEHDAPARPHERQRVRHRLRACRRSRSRRRRLRARRTRGAATSSAPSATTCVAAAPSSRARAKRRDVRLTTSTRAPAPAQHLQREQPERARRPRRPRVSPGRTARAGHRPHDDGERLGHQQIVVGDRRRRRPAAARGDAHDLGEAAVDVDADRGSRQAEVAVALAAERTGAARVVRLDDHAVADPRPGSRPPPTASTWPTNSWPSTRGYATGRSPVQIP